jgi:CHASE3 domain sensor protein
MVNTKDKVADAAATARPYVERALRDKELRDNIRNAYTSARAVYDELSSRRRVSDAASQLAADKDLQDEIRSAIEEIRNAAGRVKNVKRAAPEPARAARNSLLLFFGIMLGLLLNPITGPALRRALGRKLFGSGNGFVYQGNGTKTSS